MFFVFFIGGIPRKIKSGIIKFPPNHERQIPIPISRQEPKAAGDWYWNLPWVMRWEFYNPWFIFSGDSHYSIISWNLSTKGQNYAKKLRIGLSFSLVTETNQSPTVGNSRRFSNPQLFLLKYCDDLTKFFLKVKKIVKFVDIIFYINSTLL